MLTKQHLRTLATTQSYDRGQAYYRSGAVRKLKQNGQTFTARVYGSAVYDVTLTFRRKEPVFDCSCPYEFGGICKHCVAVGLAVIDQFGTIELVEELTASPTHAVDLEQIWQQTSSDQKLAFLRQLLDKQVDLRSQLAQFVGINSSKVVVTASSEETVDSISTAVFEALSDLRFDDDTLDMDEDDYYSEDGPDPDPVLETVLQPYAGQVSRAFGEGRLADGMTIYLGVYEGIQSASDPDYDNYSIIGDYPSQSLTVWNHLLEPALTGLAQRVISAEQVQLTLRRLAERMQVFDEAEHNDEALYVDLKGFEPLLLALTTDVPSAREVQRAIDLHHWQKLGTEYMQLRIADVLNDGELWLKTADSFADHDAVIALQLLQRQQQVGDQATLLKTLHRLTEKFPRTFDPFILETFDQVVVTPGVATSPPLAPGPDLNLFLDALANRCRNRGQLVDYLRLCEYYSTDQRLAFADGLMSRTGSVMHPLFYAQVLHTENRLSDLFAYVKRLDWLNVRDMADILKLTAPTYSGECMDMTMERTLDYLDNGQRGRFLYQAIASWLSALNQLQALKPQVSIFAEHLYKTYSRLNALREELRTARLVAGKR